MYNKTIKKSIVFITLLSIVFSCFSSLASVSIVDLDYVISIPNYALTADDVVNVDPQDQNGYYLATYRVKITPYIYFRGSGYANGHFSFYPTFALYDGQGNNALQMVDIKIEGETLLNDNYYATVIWGNGVNNGSTCCFGSFNNFYVDSSQNIMPFPSFWVEVKYYLLSENYRPTLTLVVNANDSQSSISYNNSPTDDGLADIITNAIIDSLGSDSYVGQQYYSSPLYYLSMLVIGLGTVQSNQDLGRSLLNSILNNLSALQGYVDGVEGLLTNIYNQIVLLYGNIDYLIDTISYLDESFTILGYSDSLNGTYTDTFPSGKYRVFIKLRKSSTIRDECLYKICIPVRNSVNTNNFDSVKLYYQSGSSSSSFSLYEGITYFTSRNRYIYLYTDYNNYSDIYSFSRDIIIEIHSKNNTILSSGSSYPWAFYYLPSTDIEYWYLMTYFVNYNLLHTGENETEVQNELAAAATQMEQAAAAMNVTKPAPNTVLPESLVSGDIAAAQGTLFSWLSNNYILSILIACFTIALIGFVIYGKSG